MIRGLYTSASGMITEGQRVDVIANNMANVDTTGFKKDRTIFSAYLDMQIHRFDDPIKIGHDKVIDPRPFIGVLGTGAMLEDINTDYIQGTLHHSSNPLDLALRGEGFFTVQTPQGLRYTRDGSFTINREGYITTKDGFLVLGEQGPILLSDAKDVKINTLGQITINGQVIDTLRVVRFNNLDNLQKQGDNLYQSEEVPIPSEAGVVQYHIEKSNVNTVKEMVDLITAFRSYEANQRAIKTHDETLDKVINEIARI